MSPKATLDYDPVVEGRIERAEARIEELRITEHKTGQKIECVLREQEGFTGPELYEAFRRQAYDIDTRRIPGSKENVLLVSEEPGSELTQPPCLKLVVSRDRPPVATLPLPEPGRQRFAYRTPPRAWTKRKQKARKK